MIAIIVALLLTGLIFMLVGGELREKGFIKGAVVYYVLTFMVFMWAFLTFIICVFTLLKPPILYVLVGMWVCLK